MPAGIAIRRSHLLWIVIAAIVSISLAIGMFLRSMQSPLQRAEPRAQTFGPVASAAEVAGPMPVANPATDWPCLFGPTHQSIAPAELKLPTWSKLGLRELWRRMLGTGYSCPVIVGDRLLIFHREKDSELVECLNAATGAEIWKFAYSTSYVDRYGYNNGPRCTPIVDGNRVYTFGAEGKLYAIDFATGKEIWFRAINVDYNVEQGFFGVGATPWLEKDRLIINAGGKESNAGIIAVDTATGKTIWQATSDGASYATPYAATIHNQRHVFVFTEAGLVDVEPEQGKVRWSIPFRSRSYESVNATSPDVAGDVVIVSASYNTGTLVVRIKPDGSYEQLWKKERPLDSHFSNLILRDGLVYGFSGRHEQGATFRCVELETGNVRWKWETLLGRGSSVRFGEQMLLWGERGHLVGVTANPEGVRVHSYTAVPLLEGPCWTPPAVAGSRLYLRNESTILCLDLATPTVDDRPATKPGQEPLLGEPDFDDPKALIRSKN